MADYNFIAPQGVIVPDMQDTRTDVQNEFRQIFGDDLDVSPETPQGVLITTEALARDAVKRNNAALANQINPNLAGGVFLDAIWALTGGGRVRSTRTIVRGVILRGRPQTIIPQNVVASTNTQDRFRLTGAVILNDLGLGTGVFEAVEPGPVACPAGSLNIISGGAPGWEGVENPTPGELGKLSESDQSARVRRRRTLALQGRSLSEAIMSGVYNVQGVRSALYRENVGSEPMVEDDVTLAPHSVYVCVDGGDDMAIAKILLLKKSVGAGWTGSTEVTVVDEWSGQPYLVKFQRPAPVTVYVEISVKAPETLSDPAAVIRKSILDYAQGDVDGEDGFVVGGDVSGFELASAVNRDHPNIFVRDVQIGTTPGALGRQSIPIMISQKAFTFEGAINVKFV